MTGPQADPRRAVVLLSGGLDSATILAIARREGGEGGGGGGFECHTLAFDYGQRHRHELEAAARIARSLGARSHQVVGLDTRLFAGSALTTGPAVPKDRPHDQIAAGIPSTYVPARNLVFLSMAVAYAETLDAHDIFIGVNAIDYSGYPDCRPEFIAAFERAANLGTKAGQAARPSGRASSTTASSDLPNPGLRIHAPLVHMTKAEIIRLGVSLGVDYALTHSCYDPVPWHGRPARVPTDSQAPTPPVLACGRCDSCTLRREGFHAAGIPDPTRYA
jgi:7-cyano-7-deazaguanine synthase